MIVKLPKYFHDSRGEVIADKLYLNNILGFEKLIYDIVYSINPRECFYCKKKLKKSTRTIDHLFPRALGGISIPDNLMPACGKCNSKKGDKTLSQFLHSLELNKKELSKFNADLRKWAFEVYSTSGFFLPKSWITEIPLNQIKGVVNKNRPIGAKYLKYLNFFETFGKLPKPVIVDCNLNLLDEWNILAVAKKSKLKIIPAIWCENIEF